MRTGPTPLYGFWKMEESYHTTIQASPRMTALPTPVRDKTN